MASDEPNVTLDRLDSNRHTLTLRIMIKNYLRSIKVDIVKKDVSINTQRLLIYEKKFVQALKNAEQSRIYQPISKITTNLEVSVFGDNGIMLFHSTRTLQIPDFNETNLSDFVKFFFSGFPEEKSVLRNAWVFFSNRKQS